MHIHIQIKHTHGLTSHSRPPSLLLLFLFSRRYAFHTSCMPSQYLCLDAPAVELPHPKLCVPDELSIQITLGAPPPPSVGAEAAVAVIENKPAVSELTQRQVAMLNLRGREAALAGLYYLCVGEGDGIGDRWWRLGGRGWGGTCYTLTFPLPSFLSPPPFFSLPPAGLIATRCTRIRTRRARCPARVTPSCSALRPCSWPRATSSRRAAC